MFARFGGMRRKVFRLGESHRHDQWPPKSRPKDFLKFRPIAPKKRNPHRATARAVPALKFEISHDYAFAMPESTRDTLTGCEISNAGTSTAHEKGLSF